MSLSYVITPKFSLKSNPTEILTDNIGYSDVTDYTKNYIINGNRLIPSIYELVDLEYASWKTDMVTPTIFEYEYEDSILSGLSTCNELIIRNGWAKASHSYYCSLLPEYQTLNFQAKQNKSGIYLFTDVF